MLWKAGAACRKQYWIPTPGFLSAGVTFFRGSDAHEAEVAFGMIDTTQWTIHNGL
jgi:hypothetical protein